MKNPIGHWGEAPSAVSLHKLLELVGTEGLIPATQRRSLGWKPWRHRCSSVPAKKKTKRTTDSHWFPLEIDYYLLQIDFQSMLGLSRPKHVLFTWLNWPSKYNCGVNISHVLGELHWTTQYWAVHSISDHFAPTESPSNPRYHLRKVVWLAG